LLQKILEVGGDDEKAAIRVLAKKKIQQDAKERGETPPTDEELEKKETTDLLGLAKLNLSNPTQLAALGGDEDGEKAIHLLATKGKERNAKQAAQKKPSPSSDGVFYAYGVRKGQASKEPQYLFTFANAKVANEYFDKVQKKYNGAQRESKLLCLVRMHGEPLTS
jgi:hypothetical protein